MASIRPASISEILNGPRPKLYGVLHYGHKTGGEVILVTKEQRDLLEKKTRRSTYGSNLGRIMG